jgi:hypothetical protein
MRSFVIYVSVIFIMLVSINANAGYQGRVTIKMIFGASYIQFGTSASPTGTCNYFGRYFRFNAATPTGQNMLAMLVAAELANKEVDLWYTDSSVAGTDHNNGCVQSNMATVYGISFSD